LLLQPSKQWYRWYIWQREYDTEVVNKAQKLLQNTAHEGSPAHQMSSCQRLRNARVSRVWRIENITLWRKYVQHVQTMVSPGLGQQVSSAREQAVGTCDGTWDQELVHLRGSYAFPITVNERWLFHGTTYDKAQKIIEIGFDHRTSKASSMYGAGAYFTSQSCKSHQYASRDGGHEFYVFLARVAVGAPYCTPEVCKTVRRPPEQGQGPQLYDSIVANPGPMRGHHKRFQDHQEFVIFSETQAYPAFLISYTL